MRLALVNARLGMVEFFLSLVRAAIDLARSLKDQKKVVCDA
jgi:hypothetical protein